MSSSCSRFVETMIAKSQLEIDTDFHTLGNRAESFMTVTRTNMPTANRRLYIGSLPYVRNMYEGSALASIIPARSPSSVLRISPSASIRDRHAAICRRTVVDVDNLKAASVLPFALQVSPPVRSGALRRTTNDTKHSVLLL